MEGIYIYIYIQKRRLLDTEYVQMHLKYRSYKLVCVHLNEYEKRIYPQKSVLFTLLYMCKKSQSLKKSSIWFIFLYLHKLRNSQGISYFNKPCTIVFIDRSTTYLGNWNATGSPGQNLKRMRHGNIFHAFWTVDQVPSVTPRKTKALRCNTQDLELIRGV